jgi:hypothetical protein
MISLTTILDPHDDARECERLEIELLSEAQRRFLDNERRPRWELNPPQREEYDTPRNYVLALGRYADAAAEAAREEAHQDSYFDDPLRGTNKC